MKPTDALLIDPLHDDTYPLKLGWTEFIGSGGEGKHIRTKVINVVHTATAAQMTPNTDKLLTRIGDGYRIYAARYSLNPERHTEAATKLGPGVVTMIEGLHVGSSRKHFIWIHRDHRGSGLGQEQGITWLLYYGYEAWTFMQDKQYRMNDAAVRLRRNHYDKMIERGIVVNVDEGD